MLHLSNPKLLKKILSHDFDKDDSDLTFTQRLARDNGWSFAFAKRVVDEYRKFMYLICISNQPLTPSDEVDQVWHLHLLYTHDYWDNFCQKTLEKNIYHGPTKGGTQEALKYQDCYEQTLLLYQQEFGSYPPTDIWPN